MGRTRDAEYLKQFGGHLRNLRTAKGWSQEAMEDETGMDRSQLAKIEQGNINATLSTLKVLAKAFDITVSELVDF